ncbi:hypothetical protein Nepgr_001154 [Nepenthes gracilis]|uniref:Plastid lipid-associated protein/fibrillin conserved domain-containing protein n=1 Tax=Nepenthes gracilis TaxID=150966 RepID=A0AAD3RXJ0_NEPGR|nr:hypothetical protein Nepgr_001154 [Nepenthes gracilis]
MAVASAAIFSVPHFSDFRTRPFLSKHRHPALILSLRHGVLQRVSFRTSASVTASPKIRTGPDDLVASILSKVTQTDRGVLLTRDEHKEVAEIAQGLEMYCIDSPVKSPLIFGEWDVVYCSVPTSPGGPYRVSFSALGFFDGEVSLKGKLKALDERWIQVVFEPPELKVGPFQFKYGGESEVQLQITYIDEKIRLGKGSRGSLFVFQRRE